MCSGNAFVPPRDWNHELHNLVGCDHVSIMARRLDAFLEDFMLHHHYNRRASDPQTTSATIPTPTIDSGYATRPLTPFRITRRMREDAAKEPRGETITFGPASPITFPQGCHKPDFLGHEQPDPKVDKDVLRRMNADLESCRHIPNMFTETDGTDGKTAADCFAKGGIANLPETTFGGFPVAAPIDLPPAEAKPRVRGLSSIRRSWRVK